MFFSIGRRFSSWSCGCEDVTWPKRKETALRFWICVMLDDINAEYTNHRTCRYLFNVMQVIRRVMTSFYTLFSQEERNCHNIWMAEVYKVVDQPGTSNVLCLTTNWNKCVLCHEDTPEVLRCPASSKRDSEGVGYKTIADNIKGFDKVGCLPKTINLSRLDGGVGIETTFRQHQAKCHDSCRLQFNKTKLERAEKRKSRIEDNTAASKKFTRQSIEEVPHSTKTCFFCGMPPVRETLRTCSLVLRLTRLMNRIMPLWRVMVGLWVWPRTLQHCGVRWCLALKWHVWLENLRFQQRRERKQISGITGRRNMHRWHSDEISRH